MSERGKTPMWISHPGDGRDTRLVPVFRRVFTVQPGLEKAVLRLSAHGLYEAELNSAPVTENKFTPGFTSYYYRIQVQSYEVTSLLREGKNRWQTTVGDGWWRWNNNFGRVLALWGELTLTYADGSVQTIVTDTDFEVGTGAILSTDLQSGEEYDARRTPGDWQAAVLCEEYTQGSLIENQSVPVREKEQFEGRLFRDSTGALVADFGQNIAGYVRMTLRNTQPGQRVHLQHGEALDTSGAFTVANCSGGKSPFQEVTYLCKGGETETYTPHFAVFGFRYVKIEGVEDGAFTAVAVYSDNQPAGTFTCSHPLINRLVENALWSQKGNFLEVPVDCPTRERNAWTGDAQIYLPTATWFADVEQFFRKWLRDQTIEQYASGKVGITFPATSSVHDPRELKIVRQRDPAMALAGPEGDGHIGEDSVGWGDSAVWLPYQMYLRYGDKTVLEEQYDTARRWVEFSLHCMQEMNPRYKDMPWNNDGNGKWIYDTRFHYGEWNEPLPPAPEVIELFQKGGTPADYVTHMAQYGKPEVATAYTKRSCDNLVQMAQVLGKEDDAAYYAQCSRHIQAAYEAYLVAEDGTIQPGHQAAYVRALALDMVTGTKRQAVIAKLREEIEKADYHLNTGFLSTVYLLPTLCDNGMTDLAFRLLEQTGCPGWLHPITLGATTIPENWNGFDLVRDSLNHYSLGAVCQFLFEYVAGIRPVWKAPGFRQFLLKPTPGGSLTHAKASYRTRYGVIESAWQLKGSIFCYQCTVPEGTTALLTLPGGTTQKLTPGQYDFQEKFV